jgi:predicted  nucleic acid-binding Zn-ribbon protein
LKINAYILIGIIIGASVAAGATYLYILPNVVKPKIEILSQRLSDVEGSIDILADIQAQSADRLSMVEDSIKSISPLSNRVSTIEESINRLNNLSESISIVENSTISIESDIHEINNQLLSLQESLDNMYYSDIIGLQEEIDFIEYNITKLLSEVDEKVVKLVSEVDKIVIKLEKDLAFKLLKKAVAEKEGDIVTQITDEIYDELESTSNEFVQWINLIGSENVKNVLGSVIDSQLPMFIWHDQYINEFDTNKYMTYIITYFPINIDTGLPSIGEITIPRVHLIIVGKVNVAKKRVSSIGIEFLNIKF